MTKKAKQVSFLLLSILLTLQQNNLFAERRLDQRLISAEQLKELIEESKKDELTIESITDLELSETRSVNPEKHTTFMVYMAADNDLHYFAWKNIKQMEQVGSNSNINIVVQLNTPGYLNPTKRYVVKQGKRLLVQDPTSPNQKLNSGNPYTLIDFFQWAAYHYPAQQYVLVFWNHGSGAVDPGIARTINTCNLFYYNPTNKMLELDRGRELGYLNLILQAAEEQKEADAGQHRGVCFDETFKSYLTNQDLEFALHEIQTHILGGKKIDIIAFDACLMSMIEVASLAKKYAHYMVGSQEVEYGTGWNYEYVLRPFLQQTISNRALAQHIATSYETAYQQISNDYTQSALDLSLTDAIEQNIHHIAELLTHCLKEQKQFAVSNVLKKCKSSQYCTCFDEPSYIDLGHFYQNILQHLNYLELKNQNLEYQLQQELKDALYQGLELISQFVIENRTGSRLKKASGISIHFPEHSVSQLYLKTTFCLTNNWSSLLAKYILG